MPCRRIDGRGPPEASGGRVRPMSAFGRRTAADRRGGGAGCTAVTRACRHPRAASSMVDDHAVPSWFELSNAAFPRPRLEQRWDPRSAVAFPQGFRIAPSNPLRSGCRVRGRRRAGRCNCGAIPSRQPVAMVFPLPSPWMRPSARRARIAGAWPPPLHQRLEIGEENPSPHGCRAPTLQRHPGSSVPRMPSDQSRSGSRLHAGHRANCDHLDRSRRLNRPISSKRPWRRCRPSSRSTGAISTAHAAMARGTARP